MQYVFLIRSSAGCNKYVAATPPDVFLTASARAYQKHVLHGQEIISIFLKENIASPAVAEVMRPIKGPNAGPFLFVYRCILCVICIVNLIIAASLCLFQILFSVLVVR